MAALDSTVRTLYMKNYTNQEIQVCLFLEHDIEISIRTVKRILRRLGLNRRRQMNNDTVDAAFMTELQGSGQRLGCRMMVQRLLNTHGISIGRDRVLSMMHRLDQTGVQLRQRHCLTRRSYFNRGPNFLIHVDGYDKIKPYGFAIHGAICGYSRKVLWLRVNRSNNDPKVVASYFLDYVRQTGGVPRCVRMDAGTENTTLSQMQQAFRWDHQDDTSGEKSVIIGSSHSNQRIEAWWRMLRQMCTGYWIDFFKDKDAQGALCIGDPFHIECLRFCLTQLIQGELDQVRNEWNNHRVRSSSADHAQPGKPDMMFHHPQLYDARDYTFPAEISDIDTLETFTTKPPSFGCLEENARQFKQLMQEFGKEMSSSCGEAMSLYEWFKENR